MHGTFAFHLRKAPAGPGQKGEGEGQGRGPAGARKEDRADADAEPKQATQSPEDQAGLLDQFARLHEDLADGRISIEDFEVRQEELRSQLQVD